MGLWTLTNEKKPADLVTNVRSGTRGSCQRETFFSQLFTERLSPKKSHILDQISQWSGLQWSRWLQKRSLEKGSTVKTKLIQGPLCPRHPTTHTHTHAQELARKEQSRKSCGDKRSRPQLLMSASLFHTCETFCQDAESFKSMAINRHPLPGKHSLTSHQQGNF